LRAKHNELIARDIDWRITGVASRRMGWLAEPDGMDPDTVFPLQSLHPTSTVTNVRDWLQAAQPDVLFEATSLDPRSGQPAIEHIRAALNHGAHAITANKGPIVHAYDELQTLARAKGKKFLFESTVMDGVPIFSLFRDSLPVIHLQGFHGILNSTTNVILSGMEQGLTFEASLKKAQEIGVAETDASHDLEGWDAAVKVVALARVLMRSPLNIHEIQREGITALTRERVRAARAEGRPFRLVCRARRTGEAVTASVRPEQVPLSDPMASISGTSSIIHFETDIFPGLAITEIDPGVDATAYGMLADFVKAVS